MTSSPTPAILLEHVTASYDGRPALEDVSFQVPEGHFAALIGPNGAGKSTILRLLLGLLRASAGRVEVFGRAPGRGERPIGYVPQRVVIPRGFPITVLEVALMGRTGLLGPGRRPGSRDRELVRASLDLVGLGASRISREASSSEYSSRGRCAASRGSSCWTSPPRASTAGPGPASTRSYASSSTGGA